MKTWTWKRVLLLILLIKVLTLCIFAGVFPALAMGNYFNRSGAIFWALVGTPLLCTAAGSGAGYAFSKYGQIGSPKKYAIGCGAAAFLLTLFIPIEILFH